MAHTERADDAALNAESRPHALRRWLIVGAAVLVPIVLGALATVALYATRPAPPPSPPVATPGLPPSDTTINEGGTVIIEPGTTNQVRVALGEVVEIVLQSGPGQMVMSEVPGIFIAIPNPPCHIATVCGLPGTEAWTFSAVHAGVTYLKISFGRHCSATTGDCDSIHTVLLKPFSVYSRPQAQ
jgi:predicted secreted protein